MSTFEYQPLDQPQHDIRLLTLLPGSGNDPLVASISHVSLIRPQTSPTDRISLSQLQSTTPSGWTAYETLEGPYLFGHDESGSFSWEHPTTGENFRENFVDYPPLDFEPRYEALSYTWEDEQSPCALLIKPTLREMCSCDLPALQKLDIGRNLAEALRYLRYNEGDRVLWIDAVCINQDDIEEKNGQVQRMADVYNVAQRVIVWLGEASRTSSDAIRTLQYVGSQLELLKNNIRCVSPGAEEPDWYLGYGDLRFSDETWDHIFEFLRRPWFWRLWIIQEVQLANRRAVVICGSDEMLWLSLRRALVCLYHKDKLPSWDMHRVLKALIPLTIDQRELPLGHLLIRNVVHKCRDQRDRIYGLLGLIRGGFAQMISPDYSLPLSDAYKDAFLAYLRHDVRLELLRYCENGEPAIHGPPSWIPDWSSTSGDNPFLPGQVSCGVSRAHANYIPPNTLRVSGVACGTIDSVGGKAPLYGYAKIADTIRTWEPEGLRTKPYVHGGSLMEAFATIICDNYVAERLPGIGLPTLQSWKQTYLEELSGSPHAESFDGKGKAEIFRCIATCVGRRFTVTNQGHIGLGPSEAQPGKRATVNITQGRIDSGLNSLLGDVVCVLLGCSMPILLRASSEGPHTYTMVGPSYIRGLEDSAAFLGPLPEPWIVQFRDQSSTARMHSYLNTSTGLSQPEDPRLPPFTSQLGWERVPFIRKPDDPDICDRFVNISSGETRDSDPRLDPEALKARGVNVQEFDLV